LNFFALFFNDAEFVFGWWHLIIYATKNSTQKKSPKKSGIENRHLLLYHHIIFKQQLMKRDSLQKL